MTVVLHVVASNVGLSSFFRCLHCALRMEDNSEEKMRVDSCSSAIKSYAALMQQFNRATFLTAAQAAQVNFSRSFS